jgi:hypothetical protein
MSTITEPSAILQIQDKLKTLSPQELRMVENVIHDLQKNLAVSEHSEKEEDDFDFDEDIDFAKKMNLDDLDFDENGWLHPQPGIAQRLINLCRKYLKSHSNEECEQLRIERILGEKIK